VRGRDCAASSREPAVCETRCECESNHLQVSPERAAIDAYGWDSVQRLRETARRDSDQQRPLIPTETGPDFEALDASWIMARLTLLSSPAI
jgi:hypothetical protein